MREERSLWGWAWVCATTKPSNLTPVPHYTHRAICSPASGGDTTPSPAVKGGHFGCAQARAHFPPFTLAYTWTHPYEALGKSRLPRWQIPGPSEGGTSEQKGSLQRPICAPCWALLTLAYPLQTGAKTWPILLGFLEDFGFKAIRMAYWGEQFVIQLRGSPQSSPRKFRSSILATVLQDSAFTLIYPALPSKFSPPSTSFQLSGPGTQLLVCSGMAPPPQFPYPWPPASETPGVCPSGTPILPLHSLTLCSTLPYTCHLSQVSPSPVMAVLPVQLVGSPFYVPAILPSRNPFTQVHTPQDLPHSEGRLGLANPTAPLI